MPQTYKTEGIILRRWIHRERDTMVRMLTRDYGKITVRAISARKITSKLAGHLEPFLHVDLFLAKSKTIDIIAGSNTLAAHTRLRSSVQHAAAASLYAEIVDRFTQERQPDVVLFECVVGTFEYLNAQEKVNALMLYTAVLQTLEHLGYRLELYQCHNCKRTVQPDEQIKLYYQLWAIECERCRSVEDVLDISAEAVKVLRFMQDHDFDAVSRLQVSGEVWNEVDSAVRLLLRYHVAGELHAEQGFLEVMQKQR